MNTFLWKGKAPEGKVRSERVSADNAQEARAELIRRGWTELELVKDEVADQVRPQVDHPDATEDEFSPDDELRYFEGKAPGFWSRYWDTVVESKVTLLLSALLLAYGVYRGRWVPMIIGAGGLLVMLLLFPVLHVFFSLPKQYYARLNKAKVWSRWDEVLRCVERLRQARRITKIGPGELELTRCRAQALAALGQLPQGLAEFAKFENDPAVAAWTYQCHLSTIYDCAKEYEKSLEHRRKAVALKSDNSAIWIDLAYGLVRGLNRPAEAREALARAESLEITQLGRPYLHFLKGMICWREGKAHEAKAHLEQAIPAFKPYAHAPLVEGIVLLTKSYLCAVHGELGEIEAAQKCFQQTEKFLTAAKETELLEACRKHLKTEAVS